MGDNANMIRIVSGVAAVAGLLMLIGSSVFLNDWRELHDLCKKAADLGGNVGDPCKILRYWVVGAAVGIIAALIQMGSAALGFLGKGKIWAIAQIPVFLLLVIALAVPASEDAFKIKGDNKSAAMFFLSWAIIDMIFTLVSIPVGFMLSK